MPKDTWFSAKQKDVQDRIHRIELIRGYLRGSTRDPGTITAWKKIPGVEGKRAALREAIRLANDQQAQRERSSGNHSVLGRGSWSVGTAKQSGSPNESPIPLHLLAGLSPDDFEAITVIEEILAPLDMADVEAEAERMTSQLSYKDGLPKIES